MPCRGGYVGYIRKALEEGFSEMYWLGGGSGTIFSQKLAVNVDRLAFFCLLWSGFRQTALHPYPPYSNIWAYKGQVIRVDLLHLMCRRHVQHGSPQDPNMLKSLTNNYLRHPGDAWCNLQHQAHQSARNQRWQNFSNRLSSWDMRPQYLDSARQNAFIYLLSLCSDSTICRSTQGKTCELVSRPVVIAVRARLRTVAHIGAARLRTLAPDSFARLRTVALLVLVVFLFKGTVCLPRPLWPKQLPTSMPTVAPNTHLFIP